MKKILVTGGAGFIGSHLIDLLLKEGHRVTCLDDCSAGSVENISHNLGNKNFSFTKGSVLNKKTVKRSVSGQDIVFHLAAVLGVEHIVKNPDLCIIVNARGTENVLEASRKASVEKFYLASTSEVYGKNGKMPMSEDADRILGKTSTSRWSYSTVKALDEHLTFAYKDKYGLPIVVSRYFNVYGPRSFSPVYEHVITKFILQALRGGDLTVFGDGEQKRCFMYVENAAKLSYDLLMNTEGDVFNIGSPEPISIIKLARMIKRLTKTRSKIKHVDPVKVLGDGFEDTQVRIPDITKLKNEIDFESSIGLAEGLQRTIDYFRKLAE